MFILYIHLFFQPFPWLAKAVSSSSLPNPSRPPVTWVFLTEVPWSMSVGVQVEVRWNGAAFSNLMRSFVSLAS